MLTCISRLPNPLWRLINSYTGRNAAFTSLESNSNKNCHALRERVREYVRKRKSGEAKSDLKDGSDLLSLMLGSTEIFNDEFIVDELLDFLAAGTQTTQIAAQTLLSHFATDSESLERIRQESDKIKDQLSMEQC